MIRSVRVDDWTDELGEVASLKPSRGVQKLLRQSADFRGEEEEAVIRKDQMVAKILQIKVLAGWKVGSTSQGSRS